MTFFIKSFNSFTVVNLPFILQTFFPRELISLETITLSSKSGKEIDISTNEFFSPVRIISFENLPPDKIFNAPIISVLPAPVSPVKTLKPSFKLIVKSSIIPMFLICNKSIITNLLPKLCSLKLL